MITIDQLSRHEPSDTQSLDLRSSRTEKIHRIESLQRFTNLRELNLANNMITKMENLSSLIHLRILNLEFNQINKLEGIKCLTRLEELFLSYNSIEQISTEIRHNHTLRVLHLAYNDIKSIEDIRPLSGLPALTILSLIGNPFLAALNYIAFVKMLVPSLLLLDDRDASQSIIAANVYPHEEIFILRDALNKLLDQRNNASNNQSAYYQSTPPKGHTAQETSKIDSPHQAKPHPKPSTDSDTILSLLEQWMATYERKAETKRMEINDLSESYSQCVKKSASKIGDKIEGELINKINKYRIQEERGQLSQEKRQKLHKLTREIEKNQQINNQNREESRSILHMLKTKENQYAKTKQKLQILRDLKEKIQQNASVESNRILLNHILYGSTTNQQLNYKDLKRFLYQSKGLIFYQQLLSSIIFGEQADSDRIFRLKQFLGDKSLIQIINNLKEMGLKHKKDKKKYEKQRSKLIQKFQTEAQELCDQWRELQKQKWALKNSRNSELDTHHHNKSKSMLQQRYSIVEAEQRNRIMMLKKQKEHYEDKLGQLQHKYDELQMEFNRKYKQLEEFEKFFEEFKNEREIVNGLKEEIQATNQQLLTKKHLLAQLDSSVKELSAKEGTLLEKSSFYQRRAFEKTEELKLIQEKMRQHQQRLKKANDEFNLKNYEYIGVQDQITKVVEQLREYDKKIQRQKSTLQIYEEKLRNLSELENNKRNNLAIVESDIEIQRKHLTELAKKVEQAEQKLNRCIESNYQYQLKIQQNKKSLQSLADVNRTVSDMMERQTQLKRSIFELQLENQHLQEIKAKMINEIKLQYDDQDESL